MTIPQSRSRVESDAGFSLVELMVVVGIILVMGAASVPQIMKAIAHEKLRGASSSLAGLIQSSRMQAVKRNKTVTIHFFTMEGVPFAFVNDADAVTTDPALTDTQVQLGAASFQVADAPIDTAPPLDNATLSYTPLNLPEVVSFNPRGLPCRYDTGVCTTSGFIYYINDTSRTDAATAVSISPGGRIKQWYWNGSVWAD